MTRLWAGFSISTLVLIAAGLLLSSCDTSPDVTWKSVAESPDGKWQAIGETEGFSGPGNNYLGTLIYLKRTSAKGLGEEILGYPEDGSTWAGQGTANHELAR